MSTEYEPKIKLPAGAVPPDTYDPSIGGIPPDDFVVSRHRDGTPASFFAELSWDMSPYHPTERTSNLYFSYWSKNEVSEAQIYLMHEAQYITFALIWLREGSTYSINTLQHQSIIIRSLARYANESACRIQDVLSDAERLISYMVSEARESQMEALGAILTALAKIGPERLGFSIVSNRLLKEEIRARARKYRASIKQHSPMPTRIYSGFLSALGRELTGWLAFKDDLLSLLPSLVEDPMLGRHTSSQYNIASKLGIGGAEVFRPEFKDIISDRIKAFLSDRGMSLNIQNLSRALSEIQLTVKLTIQAFTGMRDDEAQNLPYHCVEMITFNGKLHYLVLGRTTKFNNGRVKLTRWVTNHEGYMAIQIAQEIAKRIYAICGVKPKKITHRINDYPLFVSPAYLGFTRRARHPKNRFMSGRLDMAHYGTLLARLLPLIEEYDLKELEQIDPHRAWREEMVKIVRKKGQEEIVTEEKTFEIGKRWKFNTHQLRRSLALYAQRSGLVSLPSLRRQLQHITEEMSRYYARGSTYARNFIGDDKQHFGSEWQEAQPVSAAISYIMNVLLTGDILFGGYGNWVEHRVKRQEGIILIDREATMRRFKRGEIAYRETLIGGCTKVGECGQAALRWLNTDCIRDGCRNMVGNLTKLERVIIAQGKMLKSLDPDSIEYRTEKADLEILIATRDKVMQK